ncbi:MAG TPA: hypothetical protein P5234_15230 [Thermoanaerobaculaceae bacterium]|nr:hypothetical protein [Thermoanaerobaculaceae bacterium]HRS17587.1 hypothetical protein [Thermoanaerobaculaceae bacterium]
MSAPRGLVDPRHYLAVWRQVRTASSGRHRPVRAWWNRVLASMPKGRRRSPVPVLRLVLWSSSVEGMAADERSRG